jgi:uncharacterized protein (DUF934 family)
VTALIRHRGVVADTWTLARSAEEVPERGDVIVPLSHWLADRRQLVARDGRVGVLLAPADDPAALADEIRGLPVVAVDFPHFTDGRGYSTARLLRERYRFAGELRAVGDIRRDQIFYLSRVGFDAFALREGEDVEAAVAALDDFSEAYQASVERPLPLFRRRVVAARATSNSTHRETTP